MAILTRAALVLIAALGATAAAAQSGVPTLNVTTTCRPLERSDDLGMQIDTQRCLKTENEARAKLASEWSKYPAADRGMCIQTARMGGFESYVQLLTCLELRHDLVAGAPPSKPATGSPMRTNPAGLPAQ